MNIITKSALPPDQRQWTAIEPFEFVAVTEWPFNAHDLDEDFATEEAAGDNRPIRFTVFRAKGARLSKEYTLLADGSVDADGGTQLQYGDYEVVSYDATASVPVRLTEIGSRFEGLPPFAAVVLGVPKDGSLKGNITTKARKDIDAPALARTLDDFGWPDGVGLLFCDGDGVDGLYELLCGVYPPFKDVAALVRPSASASVVNPATGEALKVAEHLYAVIDDPSLSKDCLKALLRLMWVHGKGWLMLGKDGHVHVRGPIDVAVGSPERLSYEGAAVVNKGLATLPRSSQVVGEAGIICAKDLLAYADQVAPQDKVNAMIGAAMAEPEFVARQIEVKAKHRAEHVRVAVARGKPREKAEADYDRTIGSGSTWNKQGEWTFRELPADHTIWRKDKTNFTIEDIQRDPRKTTVGNASIRSKGWIIRARAARSSTPTACKLRSTASLMAVLTPISRRSTFRRRHSVTPCAS